MSAPYIGPNARVSGSAQVFGSAVIRGDGRVSKPGDYLTLGPSLISQRFVTAHRDEKPGVRVSAGCFSGTIDEFEAAAKETHANNPQQRAQYELFALMFRSHFELLEAP